MLKRAHKLQPEDLPFEGEKVRVDSLLNKEIIIVKYKIRPSKYKHKCRNCATVQFKESEEDSNKVFFTGSEVLIDMLEKYKEELPFMATIRKIDRYYTFS